MPKRAAKTYSPHYTFSDTEHLRNHLKLKSLLIKNKFKESHGHAQKFLDQKGIDFSTLRNHSINAVAGGAIASYLLLTPPTPSAVTQSPYDVLDTVRNSVSTTTDTAFQKSTQLVDAIKSVVPQRPRPLTRVEEKYLEQIVQNIVNIPVRATLEGEHLNTTYGYIGAEQHLTRYPGDTMASHSKVKEDDEGMAPGKGAWGYFANSKEKLTPDLVETEKWYAVVQTMYLPDWNKRTRYLREWYKYRKVLIVNTNNGKAVVASIADSGPAIWTGKSFGGSPEVMDYLGGPRYKKGPVVLFFVDDPKNKIPLGPVDYSQVQNANLIEASTTLQF